VKPGEGLWIERSPSIHMFFMPYAIDAVFVAKAGRVTKVAAHLKPWRIVAWARGARDCLELRAGAATESGTQVGDQSGHRGARRTELTSYTSRTTARP
jgi:uncharacterized membrane protein (UPF0127 family)